MEPHGTSSPAYCANCRELLLGAFCHRCGQAAQVHRSLPHLLHESLHHLLHFETRGWQTLPLLIVRPGVLTRRYIEGQRARYLAPLPLFLFCVFLLFLVYSVAGDGHVSGRKDALAARAELTRQIEQDRAQIEQHRARQAVGAGTGDPELAQVHLDLAAAQAARALIDQRLAQNPVRDAAADAASARTFPGLDDLNLHTGLPPLDRSLKRQLANPELLIFKLRSAASKLAVVLVPLSLPFLWLMFLGRPGVTLYDHAVFSLYSLSFMSLLFIAAALLGAIGLGAAVAPLVVAVPPLHMFAQLRGTYQLGVGAAVWRTLALLCVAGGAFVLFLLLIVALALR